MSGGLIFNRLINQSVGVPSNPENTVVRLSDGTPLIAPGALGPGSQLQAANLYLWSLGAGFKRHGRSVISEGYLLVAGLSRHGITRECLEAQFLVDF